MIERPGNDRDAAQIQFRKIPDVDIELETSLLPQLLFVFLPLIFLS